MLKNNLNVPHSPDFDIRINGSALPLDALVNLNHLQVDLDLELASMFTLELMATDNENNGLKWIDDQKLFAIGNSVEIKMGYQDNLETVMSGEITGLEPEFTHDQLPILIVRGYDRRHWLMRGRKTRTFVQQTDSDIAVQVARDAKLNSQVQDSQVVHAYVLQANQTDLEFLQERARRIQYEVLVEDKTLFFRPVANKGSEDLILTMLDDILEFYPRLSSLAQVSQVTVRAWSVKDKAAIVGQAQTGDEVSLMGGQGSGAAASQSAFGNKDGMLSLLPVLTQAEADQIARAQFNRIALDYIIGEGMCWGRTDLKPGQLIKIEGIGQRFSGQYYVDAVSHRISSQHNFETHFKVRRNAI